MSTFSWLLIFLVVLIAVLAVYLYVKKQYGWQLGVLDWLANPLSSLEVLK